MTFNRTMTVVALVLGATAVFGEPHPGDVVTLNTRELATIVESKVDHVTAMELADWIIQGSTEYRLIDIREPKEYAEYHIPTAENVSIVGLSDHPLLRNEKIVLYSEGGIHSAQAWMLLRARGYQGVYMILGGLDAWKEEVLFPALPADASTEERAAFERVRSVSKHFGGTPRTGVEAEDGPAAVPLPKVESVPKVVPTRKKKKKEGC